MATSTRSRRSHRSGRSRRAALVPSFEPRALMLPGFLVAAIILGGATAAGVIPNLLLQLGGAGLLFFAAMRPLQRASTFAERMLIWLGVAFVLVALAQMVPLPAGLWSSLPGHAPLVRGFTLIGAPVPPLPLSIDPAATMASLLSVSVAAGMFVLVVRADDRSLAGFALALPVMAALSVLIGLIQLVNGDSSPLYLYTSTNRGQPVGFFANSNHLATLVLTAVPFLAALVATVRARDGRVEGWAADTVILGALGVLLLLGAIVDGSIAGLGLLVPTLLGSYFLARRGRDSRVLLIGALIALVLVGVFVALSFNSPILAGYAKTSLDAGPTSRLGFYRHTLAAIGSFFPFGSGLGSFITVFPAFEDPHAVDAIFVNHAHNDYLEFVLELGLPGAILIVTFLGWWAWRTVAIWRDGDSGLLPRAATISSAVILAHSLVDYPARTAAILAVMVACCAIMARPGRIPPPPPLAEEDAAPARHLAA
ncbi:O-antigen ligase family protein [Sphingomonas sp. RT2P30]